MIICPPAGSELDVQPHPEGAAGFVDAGGGAGVGVQAQAVVELGRLHDFGEVLGVGAVKDVVDVEVQPSVLVETPVAVHALQE